MTQRSLTVKLNTIQHLFWASQLDAFQPAYQPDSGIDQIVLSLKSGRLNGDLHVTFLLPAAEESNVHLKAEVDAALKRYCTVQIQKRSAALHAKHQSVVRRLLIGLLILGLALGLAAAISNAEFIASWLRNLLSNSISILGTVALWSPVDNFLFGLSPLARDVKIYQVIKSMTFDIQFQHDTST